VPAVVHRLGMPSADVGREELSATCSVRESPSSLSSPFDGRRLPPMSTASARHFGQFQGVEPSSPSASHLTAQEGQPTFMAVVDNILPSDGIATPFGSAIWPDSATTSASSHASGSGRHLVDINVGPSAPGLAQTQARTATSVTGSLASSHTRTCLLGVHQPDGRSLSPPARAASESWRVGSGSGHGGWSRHYVGEAFAEETESRVITRLGVEVRLRLRKRERARQGSNEKHYSLPFPYVAEDPRRGHLDNMCNSYAITLPECGPCRVGDDGRSLIVRKMLAH